MVAGAEGEEIGPVDREQSRLLLRVGEPVYVEIEQEEPIGKPMRNGGETLMDCMALKELQRGQGGDWVIHWIAPACRLGPGGGQRRPLCAG